MASDLAPVYLDDARVTLQGDPRPQVAKILQAGGHSAGQDLVVVRLREAAGADGHPVGLTEVIDREEAVAPVYLRILKGPRGPTAPVGDVVRGTEAVSPTRSGEASARKGTSQGFAESQSFGDPAHKGGSPRVAQGARPSKEVPPGHVPQGGIRTQETASEEGGLEKASEEE